MPHLYIAAPQKSSGKTTLTIGLCREWRERGLIVQPFKKGPDFIDPMWLSLAAGRTCFNLDFYTMPAAEITASFAQELTGADLGIIEGNVGLFDSTALNGADSNAELAKQLKTPVVLVINCHGLARGIAPLLLGYCAFDPELHLAGVILNRVGGARHAANLIRVVEHYTDLPVLGVLERDAEISIDERHLGLMPSNETNEADNWIEGIRQRVAAQIDLTRLFNLAAQAPAPPSLQSAAPLMQPLRNDAPVRIGIAQDAAFGFYYPDDLRALAASGAELVPFSPITDTQLPAVDALLIGGGFPEYRMAELAANHAMRQQIAAFIANNGVVYAECGGLMYLCAGITFQGQRCAMVGALKAEIEMRSRPQGRGYVKLRETAAFPWPMIATERECYAHEFHHSAVVQPDPNWIYGYEVLRGVGIDGKHDGIVQGNVFACYSHLRSVGGNQWTARFLAHIRRSIKN
ncbi:cobyrinic acid a,c-diamide synthase [Chromatium okenii]|uniref:cobyrinate a,c-diamide synthase n=1 Tax=Chromatium okenii TaxID=61644 RepID=UPI0019083A0F|nr:cobyrinate a,c-diamide synthase [Chromatium okenii]MBK1642484.1 cobyrinic acid a,c-diamide synthase [Chromatium okenii]